MFLKKYSNRWKLKSFDAKSKLEKPPFSLLSVVFGIPAHYNRFYENNEYSSLGLKIEKLHYLYLELFYGYYSLFLYKG